MNACRRGSCDRGIWTKPLAFAADAESYGFCLGFSKFIRLQGGPKVGVGEVNWSFGRAGSAREELFHGGKGWIGVGGSEWTYCDCRSESSAGGERNKWSVRKDQGLGSL